MNFIKRIFSPLFLLFSILLLIYVIYRSEIVWSGQQDNYYKLYYSISFTLVSLSILTFFLSDKIKEYFIICSLSIFLGLYLTELFFVFFPPKKIDIGQNNKFEIYKSLTGKEWDYRSRKEVYEELKKNNPNIAVTIIPTKTSNKTNKTIYTFSGVSNADTIGCNENGYWSLYKSDRYGFNNPDSEWDKKEHKYLLVGDSFTNGSCVNRPDDIGSVLRNLSNSSVLNLGNKAHGPLTQYAVLREFLNNKVESVLWIYYEGNDLIDFEKELSSNILNNYLKDLNFKQNLALRQKEVNLIASELIEEEKVERSRYNSKFFKFLSFIKLDRLRLLKFQNHPKKNYVTKEFKNLIRLAKELVRSNNAQLYFIYLPEYNRYSKNKSSFHAQNYPEIKKIVETLNIPFIDIKKEVFDQEQNPLELFPFKMKGHYNVEGYKKVAEKIYEFTN